ncbi:MAG: hypothetical protein PF501_07445 [Salinisphaera sp.]|jgi:2,3-diaminopropionate biosynthesis protein SbnB|nr:hypothetical protein [Salinisphaera sp.]
MTTTTLTHGLSVIPGKSVQSSLWNNFGRCADVIRDTYIAFGDKQASNPPSYFLTFDDKPEARIIALPSSLGTETRVAGVKWISSFPNNIKSNLPRASALLILNDGATGLPLAVMDGAEISAVRTALSAVLTYELITNGQKQSATIAFVGGGIIARTVARTLSVRGHKFQACNVCDFDEESAANLARYAVTEQLADASGIVSLKEALKADVVIFATNASTPHVSVEDMPKSTSDQVILHLSLRDLDPEIILGSTNIVDDLNHCCRAQTSVHLAYEMSGETEFVRWNIPSLLKGSDSANSSELDGRVIVSPFGLGVLDLALGEFINEHVPEDQKHVIPDFFCHEARW